MEPKIVFIIWKDAAVFSTIVADKAEAERKAKTAVISQVGFLISEDEEKIIIGWEYHEYNKKFRHISSIPKSSIIEMVTLK
jgi:hypothetical protein